MAQHNEVLAQHHVVAQKILEGFTGYRTRYIAITVAAARRFAEAGWQDAQNASVDRIRLYNDAKASVCNQINGLTVADWPLIRVAYTGLLQGRGDAALAATFYNSVFRLSAGREHLDDAHAFVLEDPPGDLRAAESLTRTHRDSLLPNIVRSALEESGLAPLMADIERDVDLVSARLAARIPLLRDEHVLLLEMLCPVFYRNKGAYLVGRLFIDQHIIPVAIALGHVDDGHVDEGHESKRVIVDAFLWGESRLSVLFSFTRSYFMVDSDDPLQIVNYLQMILPAKKRWELLTSIGFFKYGKTEFIRGYRQHLGQSADKFEVSEGIRGQVMMVFGLASYRTVFKVIKDKFPSTKTVTHDDVRNAYRLVKTHDRVGRMADTQEFHVFEFPRNRFDPELLEELGRVAAQSVEINESTVIIKHLYVERMMTPLNLYILRCGDFQLTQVLEDYGYAIKDLAAANIFPGDMLLKNFGVTRHGRVVFYDYDEICYLTDVNFRELPKRDAADGGMSADPWFDVGEYDVFPEEFATFLFPDEEMQMRFRKHHADLFTAEGWRVIQAQVRSNQISDIYPYPLRERLR